MSVFSGMSRPMKAAGVALVGVAIVAAVIGGITALGGGDGSNEAGPSGTPTSPGTSSAPSSNSSSSATPPSTSTTPPSPTPPPPSTPPSGQPTSAGPGQPGQPGGDQQASNKWVTVRVFNNSTIKGLADRAAEDFRGSGWNVNEVSNYSQGIIPTTTAFYRPGTDEEAAAKQLAQEFGIKAEPRFEGIQSASPGVIVIVTKEYQSGHKGS
ncbi:LytR C-terminal domain-containing protein [Amycolatopsis tolypomycina]|uniref:LytR cell envelope-related transcriptional attenuator n=1 Tax=Amycolatopsis tolypomycina TaxID=208445 RepID=A0A1H5D1X9_9PSEU|nr:LytR C-terminal domain-containing protein [Amycolatopsis tolypomycina]SED72842.1 LytR cell envelope-related transcriptional attenuator [Amycolatopsis tolypomycina]